MEVNYSLRFINDEGDPKSKNIFVSYPWSHDEEITDDDGWVSFTANITSGNSIHVKIYYGSKFVDEIDAEDGDTFSYTIPDDFQGNYED